LGVLFASLLLLSIITCRVTGLPVSDGSRRVPVEAARDGLDRATRPTLKLHRILQMVDAWQITSGASSH